MAEKYSILYLEDDPDDGLLLAEQLGQVTGYDIDLHTVETVAAALQALATRNYNVVFTDYSLKAAVGPEESATYFVERVLTEYPTVPVVVTSGQAQAKLDPVLRLRIAHRRVGFMHKSAWCPDELMARIFQIQQTITHAIGCR